MVKDQFKMLSKKELKATKIHAPDYKPTGGRFPKHGNTPAEVLENVQYVESELVRWYESIAWVSDSTTFRTSVNTFHLICATIKEMNLEQCYRPVNGIVTLILETLRPWECSVIPNLKTCNAMFVDIFYGIINISERLLPFVEGNGRLTRFLMSDIYNAKKCVIALARIAKVEIPWNLDTLTGNPDSVPLEVLAE